MEFDAYTLDAGVYDELFEAAGAPHPHCRDLHDWLRRLSAQEVGGIQEWGHPLVPQRRDHVHRLRRR